MLSNGLCFGGGGGGRGLCSGGFPHVEFVLEAVIFRYLCVDTSLLFGTTPKTGAATFFGLGDIFGQR